MTPLQSSLLIVVLFFSVALPSATPYDILGVTPSASEEEIKKAYLRKAREAHPDLSNLPKEQAELQFKTIQSAWEQINRQRQSESSQDRLVRTAERRRALEKEEGKREAASYLESQWAQGRFSPQSIQALPRYQASKRQPLFVLEPNRSPKDEGEWEAIDEFFKKHQSEYLATNPSAEDLNALLSSLDVYKTLTGKFVQSVRSGLLQPFEQMVLERAHSKDVFLEAFQSQMERLAKAGLFLNSNHPTQEREKALQRPAEIFSKRFGSREGNPIQQLAEAVLEKTFAAVEKNITQLHELNQFVRGFSPALPPEEGLNFLGKLIEKLESLPSRYQTKSDLRELKERAASEAERIFEKNPDLKKAFREKTSLWKRFTESIPACDIILGKIAKRMD